MQAVTADLPAGIEDQFEANGFSQGESKLPIFLRPVYQMEIVNQDPNAADPIAGGARNALSIYWWWQIEDFLLSLGPYGMAAAVVLGICIAIGIIITVLRKGGGVDDIRDELPKEVNKKLPWGDAPAGTPGVYDKVGENGYLPCIPDNSFYEVDGDVLDFYRTIFNFYQWLDITADYLSV